jgi:hypothetical protein
MADLVITAAAVLAAATAVKEAGTAGATITAGQMVYRDSADGKYKLADSNSATAAVRVPRGIALNGASDGQPLTIARSGDITMNAVLTAGVAFYMSDTPGGICPVADVGAGEFATVLGIAKSTTVLALDINASGVSL